MVITSDDRGVWTEKYKYSIVQVDYQAGE